jgi:hypothetical protein
MGTRHAWLVLIVLLAPVGARADNHWFDVATAYSAAGGLSWLSGGQATVTVPVGSREHPPLPSNVVVDFSVQHGSHLNKRTTLHEDLTQYSYLAGYRWSHARRPKDSRLAFAQVLVGRVVRNGSELDGTHFAVAIGGGVEFLKRGDKLVLPGFRAQGDVVVLPGADLKNGYFRLTAGPIFRVGEK